MSTDNLQDSQLEHSMEIDIPSNIKINRDGNLIKVTGKLGTVTKDFTKIPLFIELSDTKIVIKPYGSRKKNYALVNTVKSILTNMIKGVENGFTYRLKIAFAHFPITIKVKDKQVFVENYFGERAPRISKIIGDLTKVTVSGDDVIVQGPNLEHVSQTASNIESSTKVKDKDHRVFLDGVYIYSKNE